jgi:hypothetical protein
MVNGNWIKAVSIHHLALTVDYLRLTVFVAACVAVLNVRE